MVKAREQEIKWHFPRAKLARSYLDTLEAGLVSSLVLFAPRRKGKTEFLLLDLLPAAEVAGYRVVYSSMWQNRVDPLSALMAELIEAAKPKNVRETIQHRLRHPIKGGSLEVEVPHVGKIKAMAEFPTASGDKQLLQSLPALVDGVIKVAGKGKVLLAIDEVQHLAKPEFGVFVAALRTTLDVRKAKVKVIFTGSSRNRLQELFTQIRAPLFQFSQTTDFPDLEEAFVDFMLASFRKATGRQIPPAAAYKAFLETSKTPGLFQDALERLMKLGGTDIGELTRQVVRDSRDNSGYKERLLAMRLLDREVIMTVLRKQPLYADETRKRIGSALGLEELTPGQIQVAVERLVAEQIIHSRDRGEYQIEDPQLESWLSEHGEELYV